MARKRNSPTARPTKRIKSAMLNRKSDRLIIDRGGFQIETGGRHHEDVTITATADPLLDGAGQGQDLPTADADLRSEGDKDHLHSAGRGQGHIRRLEGGDLRQEGTMTVTFRLGLVKDAVIMTKKDFVCAVISASLTTETMPSFWQRTPCRLTIQPNRWWRKRTPVSLRLLCTNHTSLPRHLRVR